ncbi:MAG: sugar phosphate isomerase/epimerase family protein [Devosia sp.]
MRIGFGSWNFRPLLAAGEMQIEDVFAWTARVGGEHIELAAHSFAPTPDDLVFEIGADAALFERIKTASEQSGVALSGICISATFIDPAQRQFQIERAKRYVETCDRLGIAFLRHDVVPWARRLKDTAEFEHEFGGIAEACGEIATHAARYGITTSVENHGFFMNGSDRIKRLLHAVNLPNFRMTLDVGNFLCVDEDALIGTTASLGHAAFVHFKDFTVRREYPGPGWFETYNHQYILGSIFGFGDLDVRTMISRVVCSGYDGFASIEFEGNEPILFGCETGLDNFRRILGEVTG